MAWSVKQYRRAESLFPPCREKRFSLSYGCLFVFFYAAGLVLASGGSIHWKSVLFVFVACLIFSASAGIGYHYLNAFFVKCCNPAGDGDYALARHPMLLSISIMMACWFLVFLALYPGVFAYDVHRQIPQAVSGYSAFHPLLHTFYIRRETFRRRCGTRAGKRMSVRQIASGE